ncbi:hypothetical protein HWV62_17716 [Athelia sp. TMB]|nr:hypothetical protein HWV62_17716 [Athelia sp. TMB]
MDQNDRETDGYTAADYVSAISQTLNTHYQTQSFSLGNAHTTYPISAFVTHLVYLRGTTIRVDVDHITSLGVKCLAVDGIQESGDDTPKYDAACVRSAIDDILEQGGSED